MNGSTPSMMIIPAPCGLAISSVTSDGQYLYALQPDRKSVYKLDRCGRIICVFNTGKKYTSISAYANGRYYAVAEGERYKIYILNSCFHEIGAIEPDVSSCSCFCGVTFGTCGARNNALFVGPHGSCREFGTSGTLTFANTDESFSLSMSGSVSSRLGSAGRNLNYTAIGENRGILFEGLESTVSSQTFIRATLLSTGATKVKRLPFGYKVRSFFCFCGRLYAFVTKNSYHGYVLPVCVFESCGMLCGEIIGLDESPYETSCCEESCNFGRRSCCTCGSGGASCSVSSIGSENYCDTQVSGDSTDNCECDVNELCRLFNCLKKLCKDNNCSCGCGCGNNVGGSVSGTPCCDGTLSCQSFPKCCCCENDTDIGGIGSCLPLGCEYNNNCCCNIPEEESDTCVIPESNNGNCNCGCNNNCNCGCNNNCNCGCSNCGCNNNSNGCTCNNNCGNSDNNCDCNNSCNDNSAGCAEQEEACDCDCDFDDYDSFDCDAHAKESHEKLRPSCNSARVTMNCKNKCQGITTSDLEKLSSLSLAEIIEKLK